MHAGSAPGTGLRKEITVRYRARALAVSALALSLVAAGCSKNAGTGGGGGGGGGAQPQAPIILDTKGTTPVPAPEVPGAKPGGTIYWLEDGSFEHLAPQQVYVSDALSVTTQLIYRMLTTYIEPQKEGGQLKLVGDLATNTGETTDGGKTWTYHLRDGIKYEDGTPITSKDVAFGVDISMGPLGANGPQYLKQALDPDAKWNGPDSGDLPPGVTTPDDKTIKFEFKEPHPELPYLVAYPTATPVPKAKYDKDKYEVDFVSSGPYKKESYDRSTKMVLVKNTNWDPKTDAVRHQYPDKIQFDFTPDRNAQTERMIADQGPDQTGVMLANVATTSISKVQNDAALSQRVLSGQGSFDNYIYINTAKVTDVDVRRALNYAFDRSALIKAVGGSAVATPSSTLLATTLPGYKKFDAYPTSSPSGDPDKAKQLLTGKTVPKLQYCFANTSTQQTYAAVVQAALARAGIQIALNPIERSNYYTTVGRKGTTCDLMWGGWSADYPDPDSTLNVLWNGEKIVAEGNQNLSYFNEPSINKKLDDLAKTADRSAAASKYGDLDEEIMKNYAPVIPTFYTRVYSLYGSKVGGMFNSTLYAQGNFTNVYVKS
jgi:peptide/nickel transport system substrate-binding protein